MLWGICGGIAEYFNVDPTLVRVAWVLTLFLGGAGVVAYIILYFVIPMEPGEARQSQTEKRLYRSRDERMLWGIGGGMGKYFGIDPTIVRVVWVLTLFLGGVGIFVYIILAIIIPLEPEVTPKLVEGDSNA
jgi:phage shock protein PspC (stress-responsive transcriptional regulator)